MTSDVGVKPPPGRIYRLRKGGPFLMNGHHEVTYNVDTVANIDANLESISQRKPLHPDVNVLLDARRETALVEFIWGRA